MTKKENNNLKKIEEEREEEEEDQQQREKQEYLTHLGNQKNAFVFAFNIFNTYIFPLGQDRANSKHLSICKTYQIRRYQCNYFS